MILSFHFRDMGLDYRLRESSHYQSRDILAVPQFCKAAIALGRVDTGSRIKFCVARSATVLVPALKSIPNVGIPGLGRQYARHDVFPLIYNPGFIPYISNVSQNLLSPRAMFGP